MLQNTLGMVYTDWFWGKIGWIF